MKDLIICVALFFFIRSFMLWLGRQADRVGEQQTKSKPPAKRKKKQQSSKDSEMSTDELIKMMLIQQLGKK